MGLADLNTPSSYTSISDVPTMWYANAAIVNGVVVNVTSNFTSLTSDDRQGACYVSARI
jgi:hypothetical protein